jgi:hypothetical protein
MALALPRAGSLSSDGVVLVGREDERALVDELLVAAGVRAGRSLRCP